MTRQQAIGHLLSGVGEDVRVYSALAALLEEQFEVALRHDSVRMEALGPSIGTLVDRLEGRRQERVALVERLLGPGARMAALIALLPQPRQELLEADWQVLETLVRRCKELNARNCRLMMDQQALMQRVLHGEAETYAPA